MAYFFELKAEIKGGSAAAQQCFDDFREGERVSAENDIILWNMQPTDEPDVYSLNAEIEADSEDDARALFDQLRESTMPSEKHGITFWGMEPCDPPASALGM